MIDFNAELVVERSEWYKKMSSVRKTKKGCRWCVVPDRILLLIAEYKEKERNQLVLVKTRLILKDATVYYLQHRK